MRRADIVHKGATGEGLGEGAKLSVGKGVQKKNESSHWIVPQGRKGLGTGQGGKGVLVR